MAEFIFYLQRFANINNSYENYSVVSGTSGNDNISNGSQYSTINAGAGNDFISNSGSRNIINADDGDDTISNSGITHWSQLNGGAGNDSIHNGQGSYITICGGTGDDTIRIKSLYATKNVIQYSEGDGNDYFLDEWDPLTPDWTLQVGDGSGTYATQSSGNDVIVYVGNGSIVLMNAAQLSNINIAGVESELLTWQLNGTTATYGTSSNAQITINGVKSLDGLSVNGKVVTVAASALNKSNVKLTGNGYTLALADDVTKATTKKAAWTLNGTTATYKSSYKTAGYTLASDSKSISYTAATTTAKGLATIQGAKSKSFTVSGNKITLKNSALNKKVTVSGGYDFNFASDYKNATITASKNDDTITANGNNLSVNGGAGDDTLKIFGTKTTVKGGDGSDVFVFKACSNVIADYAEEDLISIAGAAQVSTNGDDVIFSVGSGKVTVTGGADKEISYVDASGEHIYTATSNVSIKGKTIKLLEDYTDDSFNVADYGENLQTIDAAAVQLDLEITGNKLRNSIKGGENNETLIGGKGNDTLTGGDGSDVFIYSSGDGNDLITDYAEEDRIKIASGKASVKKSGSNVIFTVGSGKITLKGAADKVVTYIDANGKTNYYPAPTKDSYIVNGTAVTILEEYKSATFDVANVKNGNKVKRIDATQVSHDLEIIGNAQANVILGGTGDDTIYGGKGNDTLQGGEGKNIFVYKSGNDKIIDYDAGDTISLESGAMSNVSVKGSDRVITVGKGKISVLGGADKVITLADKKGNDTIISGKGNDTLWGNDGADTFIYASGNGKDKIYGFDDTDMLKITGAVSGTCNKAKTEVYFKVGSTAKAITLKDFTATTFNVNGTAYHISGTKLVN